MINLYELSELKFKNEETKPKFDFDLHQNILTTFAETSGINYFTILFVCKGPSTSGRGTKDPSDLHCEESGR